MFQSVVSTISPSGVRQYPCGWGAGNSVPTGKLVWVSPSGSRMLLVNVVANRLAGDLLDDDPEEHRVGVVVVELCARVEAQRLAEGDGELFLGRPLALRLLGHSGIAISV